MAADPLLYDCISAYTVSVVRRTGSSHWHGVTGEQNQVCASKLLVVTPLGNYQGFRGTLLTLTHA